MGHAIEREAGERHQGAHRAIEQGDRLRQIAKTVETRIEQQTIDGAPVIGRQALTQAEGQALDLLQTARQRTEALGIENRVEQCRFGSIALAALTGLGNQAERSGKGQQRCLRGAIVIGIDKQARQCDSQQAGRILGTLAIAPEPEKVFGSPR